MSGLRGHLHAFELCAEGTQFFSVLSLEQLALFQVLNTWKRRSVLESVKLVDRLGIGVRALLETRHRLHHQENQSAAAKKGYCRERRKEGIFSNPVHGSVIGFRSGRTIV